MKNLLMGDDRLSALREKYGELLSVDDLVEVYKYPSVASLKKAHSRGRFPVSMYRFEGGGRWYAKTVEVAKSIDTLS